MYNFTLSVFHTVRHWYTISYYTVSFEYRALMSKILGGRRGKKLTTVYMAVQNSQVIYIVLQLIEINL